MQGEWGRITEKCVVECGRGGWKESTNHGECVSVLLVFSPSHSTRINSYWLLQMTKLFASGLFRTRDRG